MLFWVKICFKGLFNLLKKLIFLFFVLLDKGFSLGYVFFDFGLELAGLATNNEYMGDAFLHDDGEYLAIFALSRRLFQPSHVLGVELPFYQRHLLLPFYFH